MAKISCAAKLYLYLKPKLHPSFAKQDLFTIFNALELITNYFQPQDLDMKISYSITGICCFFTLLFSAQENVINQQFPEFNEGNVTAIAVDEEYDRIYLGGNFERLIPADTTIKEFLDEVNVNTGFSTNQIPETNGAITNIVADGSGGKFLCGDFSKVGNFNRKSLVHLNAENKVTALSLELNGAVNDVLIDEIENALYIGGSFTTVNGVKRNNLCAIDLDSYDLMPWNPQTNGRVYDLEQKGDTIFFSGGFSGVGKIRQYSLTLDLDENKIVDKGLVTDRQIRSAEPDGEGGWFIGGNFTTVQGVDQPRLAHIDADGNLTDFAPNITLDGTYNFYITVNTIVLEDGVIYIGGNFNAVNGIPRRNAAALDAETGQVLPWRPNPNEQVRHIEAYNDSILLGGDFTRIKTDQTKEFLALVDKQSGIPSNSFDYNFNSIVREFKVNGSNIHVVGDFSFVSNILSNTFVTLHPEDGTFTPVDASSRLTGTMYCLELVGDTLFVGGDFSEVNPTIGVQHLAAFNWVSGELYDWTGPSFAQGLGSGRGIYELERVDNQLYIGGKYYKADGIPHQLVVSIDLQNMQLGEPLFSFFELYYDNRCTLLEKGNGELLISSNCESAQPNLRLNFGAVSRTGEILDLTIPMSDGGIWTELSFDRVSDIEVVDDKIYAAGDFIGGNYLNNVSYLLSASRITGEVDPSFGNLNGRVITFERDGDKLYFGGEFTEIDGESKRFMSRINLPTNSLDAWNVFIQGTRVNTIEVDGSDFYCGGDFTRVKGIDRANFARINKSGFVVEPFVLEPNGEVFSIFKQGSDILVGGSFSRISTPNLTFNTPNLSVLDRLTGNLIEIDGYPNGLVQRVALTDDHILLAGDFDQIGDSARAGIAALDRQTLEVSAWGRNLEALPGNLSVRDLKVDGDRVYYTGLVGYQNNNLDNLGALDVETGELVDWPQVGFNFTIGDKFNALALSDTSVYVGGGYVVTRIGDGTIRKELLEIGKIGGEMTSFKYSKTSTIFGCCNKIVEVNDLEVFGNDLIVAGVLHAGGDGIGKVNLTTGDLVELPNGGIPSGGGPPFYNEFFAFGFDIEIVDSALYLAAGAFTARYDFTTNNYSDIYSSEDWYDIKFDAGDLGGQRWDPIYTAFAITTDSDGNVHIGGDFEQIIQKTRSRFASIENVIPPVECTLPLAGVVSTESPSRDICLNNEELDIVQAEVSGNSGNGVFILHDSDYNVVSARFTGTFKLDNHPAENYFVSHVAYAEDEIEQVINLNDLTDCVSISNSFPVTSFRADAGSISTSDPKNYCVADLPATINFDRINSSGPNQGFALLNGSNQIIEISQDGSFLLEDLAIGNYKVASISTDVTVVLEDIQVNNLDPCFDYSNIIKVKIQACGQLIMASNPNPVTDVSNVTFTTAESENVQLELFDLTGKRIGLIYAGAAESQVPYQFQYDTSALPAGVYIYKLTADSEVKTVKLLKN